MSQADPARVIADGEEDPERLLIEDRDESIFLEQRWWDDEAYRGVTVPIRYLDRLIAALTQIREAHP